jgi:hypothetical protein
MGLVVAFTQRKPKRLLREQLPQALCPQSQSFRTLDSVMAWDSFSCATLSSSSRRATLAKKGANRIAVAGEPSGCWRSRTAPG